MRQLTEDAAGRLTLGPLKTKASRRTLEFPELTLRALRAWHSTRRARVTMARSSSPTAKAIRCARVTSSAALSSRCCAAPSYPTWTFTRCAIPRTHSSLRRAPTPSSSRVATGTSTRAWSSTDTVTCSRRAPSSRRDNGPSFQRSRDWSSNGRQKICVASRRIDADPKKANEIGAFLGGDGGLEPRTPTCEVNDARNETCVRNARNRPFSLRRGAFQVDFFVR